MFKSITLKKYFLGFGLIILLIFSGLFIASKFYTSYGFSSISHKTIENDRYYIHVFKDNSTIKLESSKDIYDNIVADSMVSYEMSYKWNEFYPEEGKLISINLNNMIDNRLAKEDSLKELISTNEYVLYENEFNQLNEYIDIDTLHHRTPSEVINLIGEPSYIIKYKSKGSSTFDSKVLIYSYYRSTDGTALDFKNSLFNNYNTDSIDSMDSYKVENLLSIFNN